MSDDEALYERLRRQVDQQGEGSLNRLDAWRWRTMSADRQVARRARFDVVEQARAAQQQEHAALATTVDSWTSWTRGEFETVRSDLSDINTAFAETGKTFEAIQRIFDHVDERAEKQGGEVQQLRDQVATAEVAHERLVEKLNNKFDRLDEAYRNVNCIFEATKERDERRDNEVQELRAAVADLKVKQAEARVSDLDTLHRSLVTSAKLTIDVLNQAAGQQAKVSQTEMAYRDELATSEAKANALAAELERLRSHKDFRFAREADDDGAFDLPANFLLPRARRDN